MCNRHTGKKRLPPELPTAVSKEVLWFETKADFLAAAGEFLKDGDNVLVKASHGMHLEEIVEALQHL